MICRIICSTPMNLPNQSNKNEPSFCNRSLVDLYRHLGSSTENKSEYMKLFMISHENFSPVNGKKNIMVGEKNGVLIKGSNQMGMLSHEIVSPENAKKKIMAVEKNGVLEKGSDQMGMLCGFGYWVNGFRCFPWMALNFHMANYLNLSPSTLQLVQNCGNLPLVAKPLFGVWSDVVYIGGAHRLPYISIGVLLQVLSWGLLALMSAASESLPAVMACILLSNLGASIAEVAKDALVAEYGKVHKMPALQSYAFMASAAGGILGNLIGGFYLLRTHQTKSMFLAFASILALQFASTTYMKEESLGLSKIKDKASMKRSVFQSIKKQYDDLMIAVREENIWRPLSWIVGSILGVPLLSGSMFCYQTQYLNLDSSVIGMSKVTGQLMLFFMTALYGRFGKNISIKQLVSFVQVVYAFSLLFDLILVSQLNLRLGISNEVFTLCFSGIAETVAQFKLLPFQVLLASLAPSGCEGSLMAFSASALCLSSITSGFLGVGLSSFLGITSGNYSGLQLGILVQFVAALLPLQWINNVHISRPLSEKQRRKSKTKRSRRNRRVVRLAVDSFYSYSKERELDLK